MSESIVQNRKEPVFAAIGSFIVPGSGQVYNGDGLFKGALILLGTTIGAIFFIIPGLIVWLYGIFDAYSVAKKINAGDVSGKDVTGISLLLFIVIAVVWLAVWMVLMAILAAVVAAFVFGMGTVSQGSHIVAIEAVKMSDGTIILTNCGGPDTNKLDTVKLSFVDAGGVIRGPDTAENLADYGVTGSLGEVGSSCTIGSGIHADPAHIIVYGAFDDGTTQTLLTSSL
jgi:hypothetical protein